MPSESKVQSSMAEPIQVGPGEVAKKYDVNGDKKPDLWKVYKKKGKGESVLVRIEIDLNSDGRIDIRRYYENNVKRKEEFDLDFDGKVDVISYYDEDGYLFKQEYFLKTRKFPDLYKYYEVIGKKKQKRSVLVRKERDTNLDGKVDYWEYWENGNLDRIGRDTDYDGNVDVWEKGGGPE